MRLVPLAIVLAACGAPAAAPSPQRPSPPLALPTVEAPRLPEVPIPPATASGPWTLPVTYEERIDGGPRVSIAVVPGDLAAIRCTFDRGLSAEVAAGILRAAVGQRAAATALDPVVAVGPDATTIDVVILARDLDGAIASLGEAFARHRRSARADAWLASFVRDPSIAPPLPLELAAAIDPEATAPGAVPTDPRKLTPAAIEAFARAELTTASMRITIASPEAPDEVMARVVEAFPATRAAPPRHGSGAPTAPARSPRFLVVSGRGGPASMAYARLVPSAVDAPSLAATLVALSASSATRASRPGLRVVRLGATLAFAVDTGRTQLDPVAAVRAALTPIEPSVSTDVAPLRRAARALLETQLTDPRTVIDWLDACGAATPPFDLTALAAAVDAVSVEAAENAARALDGAPPAFVVRGPLEERARAELDRLGSVVDVADILATH